VRSSAGEHYLHTVGVTGSIPVAPTTKIAEIRHFCDLRGSSRSERNGNKRQQKPASARKIRAKSVHFFLKGCSSIRMTHGLSPRHGGRQAWAVRAPCPAPVSTLVSVCLCSLYVYNCAAYHVFGEPSDHAQQAKGDHLQDHLSDRCSSVWEELHGMLRSAAIQPIRITSVTQLFATGSARSQVDGTFGAALDPGASCDHRRLRGSQSGCC
jgi:hypothetical protein